MYGDKVQQFVVKADMSLDTAPAPKLESWQMRLSPEAAAGFDDASWQASDDPQQMGADGDTSAFAWYRAAVTLDKPGHGKFHFAGSADDIEIFVNGRRHDEKTQFQAGRNAIAVFTSHRGRNKAFNYLGTLNEFYRKGLFGPVQLELEQGARTKLKVDIKGWKLRGGAGPIDGQWQAVAATSGVPAYYRAMFTTTLVPGRILRLQTHGLSRGTAWLNGHNLGRYPEKIKAPGMYLPECWLKAGANELVIFDEEGASPAAVKLDIERAASREVIRVSEPCDASTPLVVPDKGS